MPFIKVETNVVVEDEDTLVKGLSALASDMLGKPESFVMAELDAGKRLVFGGTDDPAAFVTLKSIGLDEGRTPDYSVAICAFLEDVLGVPVNRIFIDFGNLQRHLFGWNAKTF